MSKEKFVRTKPHLVLVAVIIITGLIALGSLSMVVIQDIINYSDSDGDSIPDTIEVRSKLPTYFQVQSGRLDYATYDITNTTNSHELGHNLGIEHAGVSNLLELHSDFYDDVSTGVPILEFHWQYNSLLEFVDVDDNGYYNSEEDSIVAQTDLSNMIRVNFGFGLDGQPVYFSEYVSSDGKISVHFYHAREHVLLSRGIGLLAPGELKSTIVIDDFIPITGGTNVAINITMQSNHELVFTNSSVSTSVDDYNSEYHWSSVVLRDSVEGLANITIPSLTNPITQAAIYINLGTFTKVEYDPHYYISHPRIRQSTISFISFPWSYVAIGSFIPFTATALIYIIRKKPGRVKY